MLTQKATSLSSSLHNLTIWDHSTTFETSTRSSIFVYLLVDPTISIIITAGGAIQTLDGGVYSLGSDLVLVTLSTGSPVVVTVTAPTVTGSSTS